MGEWRRSSTEGEGSEAVHTRDGTRSRALLDVGADWCAVRLERLVRNMDGRQNGGRDHGCPVWCAGEHDEVGGRARRLHRSEARSVPVVRWRPEVSADEPEALVVHVSVCRPGDDGEERLRIESDALGALDLDLSGAARLVQAVERALLLRGVAG